MDTVTEFLGESRAQWERKRESMECMAQCGEKRDAIRSKRVIWNVTAGLILLNKANTKLWVYLLPGWLEPERAQPPISPASPAGAESPSPVCCRREGLLWRWKEFCSCVWSGCSGDLDVLKVCLWWRELGLDASRGPLKTHVPKCRCRGKQAKMNMLVDTAAERDRCQLKLQSCKCLCEEIYIAAILFGIFSDYLCKHMKKNKSENCLYLLSLA